MTQKGNVMTEDRALLAAAVALRDDMLMRAERDAWQHGGDLVVGAGNGVWRRFNDAILAAAALTPPSVDAGEGEELRKLIDALAKVSPIETRDNADYADLTFGEHPTQAMTMAPRDWDAIEAAYLDARAALKSTSEGEG